MMQIDGQISPGEALLGHQGWVKALARRLVADVHGAEDLAQEVMTEALRRPPGFLAEGSRVRSWLGGVARNLARDGRRVESARRNRERLVARAEATEPTEGVEERLEVHRKLVEAVMKLEEPYRSALVLHHFDGLRAAELADRAGVSVEAARKRLSRGHRKLRETLQREWKVDGRGLVRALVPLGIGLEGGGTAGLAKVGVMGTKRLLGLGVLGLVGLLLWSVHGPSSTPEDSVRLADSEVLAGAGESVPGVDGVESGSDEREPFEGRAPSTPAIESSELRVTVVDDARSPLHGAEVLGFAEGRVLFEESSGADGTVTWEGSDSAGAVLVKAPDSIPEVLELETLRGDHPIVIAGGDELSGWVLVDDGTPVEPIEMRVEVDPGPNWLERAPESIRERWTRYSSALSVPLVTEADGRFAIRGLPEGWSGSLYCDYEYWFVEAPSGGSRRTEHLVHLTAARRGLEIRLTRLPRIVGRLVDGSTGRGVPDVRLMAVADFSDGEQTPMISSMSHDNGHFSVALSPSSHASMSRFVDPANRPEVTRIELRTRGLHRDEVPFTADASTYDVGDIEIPTVGDVVVRLVDGSGAPLSGGEVAIGGARCDRTSAEGVAELRDALAHVRDGWARAPGHRLIRFDLGSDRGSLEAPVEVVLPPANRIEVRFEGPGTSVAPPANLILEAETMPFACPGEWTAMPFQVPDGGAEAEGSAWGSDGATVMYWVDGQELVQFDDLRPGLEIEFTLADEAGTVISSGVVAAPPSDKSVEVVLRWSQESRSVVGRILDNHGAPLGGAQVSLRVGEGQANSTTDSAGTFEFTDLHAGGGLAALRVRLDGYCVGRMDGIDLERLPDPFELVLETSTPVVLRVFDHEGTPVDLRSPRSSSLERRDYRCHELGVGHFRIEGLAQGPHELLLRAGGRNYQVPVDVGGEEVRFDLPPLGTLEVHGPELVAGGGDFDVFLTPPEGNGIEPHARSLTEEAATGMPIPHLQPGRWAVQLRQLVYPNGPGTIERIPIGTPVEVEIVAGRTARVLLLP